ncbi:hypothetical protein TNCV_845791 [Trichonephila clavipes]|nr:hypothetical protein TNCV_845791 [Trichonephila clavipes]
MSSQEPLIPKKPPKNTCFELELLQPCSKKEEPVILRQKGLETVEIDSQDNFAIAYSDGSSDRSLSNGGAGILLPDEQLHSKIKSCILQWIPAHVNIQVNECADSLAKEARDIDHKRTTITLDDGHEDSPRQDKIICSMQTLPRSSTHVQSHLGMPNRHNKVKKNGNDLSEGLLRGKSCTALMLPELQKQ